MKTKFIRISKDDCLCVCEPIDYNMLKGFFSVYPRMAVCVEDKNKAVIGIISYSDFIKGWDSGKVHINKTFKSITLQENYIANVEEFFSTTKHQYVPVLDEQKKLIECFVKVNRADPIDDKWLDINNKHLVNLIAHKNFQYTKIKICMIDFLSEPVYQYFKYHKSQPETVEVISWQDLSNIKKNELLLVEHHDCMIVDIAGSVLSINELLLELEYQLLLKKCKEKNIKISVINIPTRANVWNLTWEERKRVSEIRHWGKCMENESRYRPILQEVLTTNATLESFIDSCLNMPTVIVNNQLYYMRDQKGEYVNVVNGNRITTGVPPYIQNHIYLAGDSFVFGPLVDDDHTIASLLQRQINALPKYKGYAVINEGLRGMPLYESLKRLNHDPLKQNDRVVLFVRKIQRIFKHINTHHLEDRFNTLDRNQIRSYFIDSPIHPNAFGYQLAADYVIEVFQSDDRETWKEHIVIDDAPVYENRKRLDGKHNESLRHYLRELENYKTEQNGVNGAIVMNCNPLTYGHEYLIEYAAKQVDHLYIFVVQEDKSIFSYEERMNMVKACVTEKYSNVTVLPSGSFIISAFTFPEYFTKQTANPDTKIDMSYDVTIFGEYIAPALNISVRFAGKEPTDFVTAQYNQAMARMLPEYGISFVEIPRYEKAGIGMISATNVRKAIENNNWDIVRQMVPETTYDILIEKQDS